MRLNQFIAAASALSRRAADQEIKAGRVLVNGDVATVGQQINPATDVVTMAGSRLSISAARTIVLNKPVGYVTSRQGQGGQTVYDLLPAELHNLKPAGRLDKDSSGLLVMTSDGALANRLIHPSQAKVKTYRIRLDQPLDDLGQQYLDDGMGIREGVSKLHVIKRSGRNVTLEMQTGWNRQIRRTFAILNFEVEKLERIQIGQIKLGDLKPGEWRQLTDREQAWLGSS